jgi:DNA-binding LacI/PurR family transcriptional regulator
VRSQAASVPPRTRPSLIDVARLAGVAPITVSRVANGHPNVQDTTRSRVLEAMATVGYQPNYAARALATGRFGTIGIITFTMATYGNAQTITATATAAEQQGYSVTLLTAHAARQGEVRGAFDRLIKQAVDGVIVIMEARLLDGSLILPPGVPVVVADSGGASQYCVVDSDQAGGARLATEHLLELGHRTVWHVAGPRNSFSASARRAGWGATLRKAGVRAPRVLAGDWTTRSGYLHGRTLAADAEVTAVFAANDQMALGIMRAFHEAGRDIPGQVSVVGFDDTEDSDSYWPPLTTIHQRFDEVGRLCVASLLHEMHHDTGELRKHIVPTSLVIRRSTGPVQAPAVRRA